MRVADSVFEGSSFLHAITDEDIWQPASDPSLKVSIDVALQVGIKGEPSKQTEPDHPISLMGWQNKGPTPTFMGLRAYRAISKFKFIGRFYNGDQP